MRNPDKHKDTKVTKVSPRKEGKGSAPCSLVRPLLDLCVFFVSLCSSGLKGIFDVKISIFNHLYAHRRRGIARRRPVTRWAEQRWARGAAAALPGTLGAGSAGVPAGGEPRRPEAGRTGGPGLRVTSGR